MSDLQALQQKLGVSASGTYDNATRAAIVKLQLASQLPATGMPDPPTLKLAGVYDPVLGAPEGGGGFGRDLITAFNQIPRWAWLTLAAVSSGVAYLAYRRKNP